MQDPYAVLGVDRRAGLEDIKRAYRRIVRECHPDLNPSPGADRRFHEVTEAFNIVGDAKARALFDEFGAASLEPGFDPAYHQRAWRTEPAAPQSSPFGDMSAFADAMSGLFDDVPTNPPPRPRAGPERPAERQRAHIDPMLSFTGGMATVSVQRHDGRVDSVRVRVPPGARTGDVVVVPGFAGPRTELTLEFEIPEHPLLRRTGDDLEMDLPITLLEAIQGGPVTVPTPGGLARVQLPPSCAGQKLRLKGRGVQRAERPGNLVLILRLVMPDVIDATVIEACRAIERAYTGDPRDRIRF
jgi:DnaJ-class molecular chaperone